MSVVVEKIKARKRLRKGGKVKSNREALIPSRVEKDPTLQAGNRRKAKAEIARRIKSTERPILNLLESIPVEEIQINKATYRYSLDASRLLDINNQIRRIIYDALQIEQDTGKPQFWFFQRYLGLAHRQGTTLSAGRIEAQITGTGLVPLGIERQLSIENILMSEPYRRRIELVYARSFENMQGFAGEAAENLARTISTGVAVGESPRTIAAKMRKQFNYIEGYRALRIARTEINKAYTDARTEQTKDSRDRLGIDVRVMHISALVPNTRRSHAFRHGKLYSAEEQESWWAEGTNRINCLCSTVEIVYQDGKPLQQSLIKRQRARGEAYFRVSG